MNRQNTPDFTYRLPDSYLVKSEQIVNSMHLFVPGTTAVILGNGSRVEKELNLELVKLDGVTVMRRKTGGCAVVVTPRMAVASFALSPAADDRTGSLDYFSFFNGIIIKGLTALGVDGIESAGISDLTIGGKKIAGSALFRRRGLVFYHSVINLAEESEVIARYLKHPPREPGYRAGRGHEEFVTSLSRAGYTVSAAELEGSLKAEWQRRVL